jgi:hypothetical protein
MKKFISITTFLYIIFFIINNCMAQSEWPKVITANNGTIINVYQPQPDSYAGNILKSRSAISILENGSQDPVFGVFWSTATVETDRDTREITIEAVKINNLKIPADSNNADKDYIRTSLETYIPRVMGHLSLDEMLASLDQDQHESKLSKDINNRLPSVIYRTHRSILVIIDGQPKLQKNKKWGMDVVVNSPFTIVENKDGKFFLYGGGHWYTAPAAIGPYTFTKDKINHNLKKIARDLNSIAKNSNDSPTGETPDNAIYDIIVSTKPAELIQSDGNPDLTPIARTSLLYVKNSDNDIFVDTRNQQYYVLLSGRWYTANGLNENSQWQYVASNKLPPDFADIPEGSPKDAVLASIAGTEAAREAVMDAQVPQTAKIDRRTASTHVEYDGIPQFKPVEGTDMQYAVNTSSTVLSENGKYYTVDNGIWFIASDPLGPWAVATARPQEMDLIPPTSPIYNAKYVQVYEATPDYVYMGYTPGYLNSFVDGPTMVYGTGYDYEPWTGNYYYPRPWTWGFDMSYNPWSGWGFGADYDYDWFDDGFGWGYGYGLGLGLGWGGWFGGGWWGGASGYRPAYRNWHGGRFSSGARGGYYGGNATINGNTHMHMRYNNNVYRSRQGVAPEGRNTIGNIAGRNAIRSPVGNNIFSDRQGNIYRRGEQGQWQQRVNRGWSPVNAGANRGLEQQRQMNARGAVRSQNFQHASNFGGMRFSGGGHFGGGGGHVGGGGHSGGHR